MIPDTRAVVPILILLPLTVYSLQPSKGPRKTTRPSRKKPKETAEKLARMLEYLSRTQRGDGSWEARSGSTPGEVVTAAFGALAFQAAGGGERMRKAADYVAARMFDKPVLADRRWDQTNWNIAIGTALLAETGLHRAAMERGAAEIWQRIEASGGWGHGPGGPNALGYIELQILGNWMLTASGLAKKRGVSPPKDKLDKALSYLKSCCLEGQGHVGYSHREGQRGNRSSGRTGQALCAYGLLGLTSTELYPRMVKAWEESMEDASENHGSIALGMLGCALGARQIGPEAWDRYVETHFPRILANVQADGSMRNLEGKTPASLGSDGSMGPAFNTAIYALILQLDLGHLQVLGR